jgi:hypothetical protein
VQQVPNLQLNEENLENPKTGYITITEKLHSQQTERRCYQFINDSFHGNFPRIKIIPITEAEIKSIIHSLKQNKNNQII